MTEMTPETLRIEAGGMSTESGRRRVISVATAWEGDHKIALAAQAVANAWRQGEDQPYVTMNKILTPTEVDAYRKIPHADFGVFRYSVLVATIDALAEALRAVAKFSNMNTHVETIDPCKYMEAEDAANVAAARVTAWLEET